MYNVQFHIISPNITKSIFQWAAQLLLALDKGSFTTYKNAETCDVDWLKIPQSCPSCLIKSVTCHTWSCRLCMGQISVWPKRNAWLGSTKDRKMNLWFPGLPRQRLTRGTTSENAASDPKKHMNDESSNPVYQHSTNIVPTFTNIYQHDVHVHGISWRT